MKRQSEGGQKYGEGGQEQGGEDARREGGGGRGARVLLEKPTEPAARSMLASAPRRQPLQAQHRSRTLLCGRKVRKPACVMEVGVHLAGRSESGTTSCRNLARDITTGSHARQLWAPCMRQARVSLRAVFAPEASAPCDDPLPAPAAHNLSSPLACPAHTSFVQDSKWLPKQRTSRSVARSYTSSRFTPSVSAL